MSERGPVHGRDVERVASAVAGPAAAARGARRLLIVLSAGDAAERAADAARRGEEPVLFCPGYDHDVPGEIAGRRVLFPMDVLTPADIDAVYAAAFAWQRDLPAVRVRTGLSVFESCGPAPQSLWAWLFRLYPHVHIRIRLIETVARALEVLRPASAEIVGDDAVFPWMRPVIERTLEQGPRVQAGAGPGREAPHGAPGGAADAPPTVIGPQASSTSGLVSDARTTPRAAAPTAPTVSVAPATTTPRPGAAPAGGPARAPARGPGAASVLARVLVDMLRERAAEPVRRIRANLNAAAMRREARRLETLRGGGAPAAKARVPAEEGPRLTRAQLLHLGFVPWRHRWIEAPAEPEQSGTAYVVGSPRAGTVRIDTGERFACAWPGACPERLKTSVTLRLAEMRAHDASLRVRLCNGRHADELIVRDGTARLASGGDAVELRPHATVVVTLYGGKSTLVVDKVERHRGRTRPLLGRTRPEIALRVEVQPGGGASIALTRLRISYAAPKAAARAARKRRRAGDPRLAIALRRLHREMRAGRARWLRPARRVLAARLRRVAMERPEFRARWGRAALAATRERAARARVAPGAGRGGGERIDAAEAQVRALAERTAAWAGRGFAGHAVLLLAGRAGSGWYFSHSRGEWMVFDEYIEHVPEACIDYCRAHNWRLTIVYQREAPEFVGERRSYSERFPAFVEEMTTAAFARVLGAGSLDARAEQQGPAERLLSDPAFVGAFSHRGVGFFDQLERPVSDGLRGLAANYVAQSRAWGRVLSALGADVVFGGRLEHLPAINAGAHAAGARTVTVKLGISEEMLPSVIAVRPDGTLDRWAYPDLLLVWGEWQKGYLASKLPELAPRVAVSGRTRSDSFAMDAEKHDAAAIRGRLGLGEGDDIIVFGGTCRTRYGLWPGAPWGTCCMSPASLREAISALRDVAESRPGTRLIVKPHPSDDVATFEAIVAELASERVSIVTRASGVHNAELLAASKVFVSSVSSMFAEAVLCGRAAVNLWTPDVNYLYEGARTELYGRIAHSVGDARAMAAAVRRFLDDPAAYEAEVARARANLPTLFGSMDGGNARRAVDAGCALVRRERRDEAGEENGAHSGADAAG